MILTSIFYYVVLFYVENRYKQKDFPDRTPEQNLTKYRIFLQSFFPLIYNVTVVTIAIYIFLQDTEFRYKISENYYSISMYCSFVFAYYGMDTIERIRWKNKEYRRYVHHWISMSITFFKFFTGKSMNILLYAIIISDLCTFMLNY